MHFARGGETPEVGQPAVLDRRAHDPRRRRIDDDKQHLHSRRGAATAMPGGVSSLGAAAFRLPADSACIDRVSGAADGLVKKLVAGYLEEHEVVIDVEAG